MSTRSSPQVLSDWPSSPPTPPRRSPRPWTGGEQDGASCSSRPTPVTRTGSRSAVAFILTMGTWISIERLTSSGATPVFSIAICSHGGSSRYSEQSSTPLPQLSERRRRLRQRPRAGPARGPTGTTDSRRHGLPRVPRGRGRAAGDGWRGPARTCRRSGGETGGVPAIMPVGRSTPSRGALAAEGLDSRRRSSDGHARWPVARAPRRPRLARSRGRLCLERRGETQVQEGHELRRSSAS